MKTSQVRKKYIEYFKNKNHTHIPSSPLVPINDPSTLFVSSGMQPLVPFLLGEPHPSGTRLVNSQICLRAHGFNDDVMDVGDNRHTSFFEMLGNWSLGDYFKDEQLRWIFDFLVNEIGLDPNRIYTTVFSGDPDTGVEKDEFSINKWKEIFKKVGIDATYVELNTEENASKLGMQGGRIFSYGVKKNWWSRSGPPSNMPVGEIGGPDSEIFYDTGLSHDEKFGEMCHPNCDCGRFLEIGNSVFIQYKKVAEDKFEELPQKNIDFGGGLSRIAACSEGKADVFETDLFKPIIDKIASITGLSYKENAGLFRVLADHANAVVFMINADVIPSNKQQGYILRKFLRRMILRLRKIDEKLANANNLIQICESSAFIYSDIDAEFGFKLDLESLYPKLSYVINNEFEKFSNSLSLGLKEFKKQDISRIDEKFAFHLYQSFGFPFELTYDLAADLGNQLDNKKFLQELNNHQQLSKSTSDQTFKGGLADKSEQVIKYHTLTHILHQALFDVFGTEVRQEGSNITSERLRFDYFVNTKPTKEQIQQVEDIVNRIKDQNLEVISSEMSLKDAVNLGAKAFFREKYADVVKVYSIGGYSKEICGGPHVKNTAELKGKFRIIEDSSVGANIRRIKAVLI